MAAASAPLRQSEAMNSGCEPELQGDVPPQRGEMPGLVHQDLVAGRERVEKRRLPRPGAGGGIDHHRAGGLEDGPDAREHPEAQLLELRPPVVDHRHVHGPQNAVRHRRRPGDLQEMPPCAARFVGHRAFSPPVGLACDSDGWYRVIPALVAGNRSLPSGQWRPARERDRANVRTCHSMGQRACPREHRTSIVRSRGRLNAHCVECDHSIRRHSVRAEAMCFPSAIVLGIGFCLAGQVWSLLIGLAPGVALASLWHASSRVQLLSGYAAWATIAARSFWLSASSCCHSHDFGGAVSAQLGHPLWHRHRLLLPLDMSQQTRSKP